MHKSLCGLLAVLLATFVLSSFGGEKAKPARELGITEEKLESENFAFLRDKRARLLAELPQLDQDLLKLRRQADEVRSLASDVARADTDISRAKSDLELAKKEKPGDPRKVRSLEDQMRFIEQRAGFAKSRLESFDDKDPKVILSKIREKEAELAEKKKELANTEATIDNLLNVDLARQSFKTSISLTFAGLVLAVILGFFFIAWTDEKVRQAVFSGQSGIQLLTLFSLVIAIILFGIIGILEGKELSALLGGLSGYILGRVTQPNSDPAGSGSSQHPPVPQPAPPGAPGGPGAPTP